MADWEGGLIRDVRAAYPHLTFADAGTRDQWDFHLTLPAEERDAFRATMNTAGFYGNLPVTPGAQKAFRKLHDRGINHFVCTTPSADNPSCASDKLVWNAANFGDKVAANTILTFDKTVVRGDILLDDKPEITGSMIPEWEQVVFDQPYNRNTPGRRMTSWDQLFDIIAGHVASGRDYSTDPFTVLFDMDGVIFDWEGGIVRRARINHPNVKIADAGTRDEWDFFPNTPADEAAALREAMAWPGLFRELDVFPGAVEVIRALVDAGVNVLFCSTPALYNESCASDKLWAIGEHFGKDMVKRVVLTQDKTLIKGDILFDDKPVIDGLLAPTWERIVYDQSYNKFVTGPRMFAWPEAFDLIDSVRSVIAA